MSGPGTVQLFFPETLSWMSATAMFTAVALCHRAAYHQLPSSILHDSHGGYCRMNLGPKGHLFDSVICIKVFTPSLPKYAISRVKSRHIDGHSIQIQTVLQIGP